MANNNFRSSRVSVRETAPRLAFDATGETAVTGMVGTAEKGPVATPVLLTSFDEFLNIFGGFTTENVNSVASVKAFFDEGGVQMWFSRTAHWLDILDPARGTTLLTATGSATTEATALTAAALQGSRQETFLIPTGATLTVNVDGAPVTATFMAATAASLSVAYGPTADLSGLTLGDVLITFEVDGTAGTVTYNPADYADPTAATTAELVALLNTAVPGSTVATPTGYDITSPTTGVASEVVVTAADALTGATAGAPINGTAGDIAVPNAATLTEVLAVLNAAGLAATSNGGLVVITSPTTGSTSTLQVDPVDMSVVDALGLPTALVTGTGVAAAQDVLTIDAKYPGAYGNELTVEVAAASSGLQTQFDLVVRRNGAVVSSYRNLDLTTVADAVNEGATADENISVTVVDPALVLAQGTYTLAGGSDGDPVTDLDFIGDEATGRGIHALDSVEDLDFVMIPARNTPAVHQKMLAWVEDAARNLEVVALLSIPEGNNHIGARAYVIDNNLETRSEFGHMSWPHVQVINPAPAQLGTSETLLVPPAAFVAGRHARHDASNPIGVYQAAAGLFSGVLRSAVGLETLPGQRLPESDVERKRDLVYVHNINPISTSSGQIAIDGTKMLATVSNGNFISINQRRGASFVESILRRGLEVARFRNITDDLLFEVEDAVKQFLLGETARGAFASTIPDDAFFVDAGPSVNTATTRACRLVRVRVGLCLSRPADYIEILVSPAIKVDNQ